MTSGNQSLRSSGHKGANLQWNDRRGGVEERGKLMVDNWWPHEWSGERKEGGTSSGSDDLYSKHSQHYNIGIFLLEMLLMKMVTYTTDDLSLTFNLGNINFLDYYRVKLSIKKFIKTCDLQLIADGNIPTNFNIPHHVTYTCTSYFRWPGKR